MKKYKNIEFLDKNSILDPRISYELSVEHRMALENTLKNDKNIVKFNPFEVYKEGLFDYDPPEPDTNYNPKRLHFIYPERPARFIPELDYKLLINPNCIAQPKYNGWRMLIIHDIDGYKFYSRRGKEHKIDIKLNLPEGTILDCELISIDKGISLSSHNRVTSYIKKSPDKLMFIAFDILYFEYKPTMYNPLEYRLELLKEILSVYINDKIRLVETVDKDIKTFERLINDGYEGIVLKLLSSMYEIDGCNWVKIKDVEDLKKGWEYAYGETNILRIIS